MIHINFRDPRPIYEQVRDNFRQLILSGVLPSESKMPSVRELASSLAINPNTIQRAYNELESEGYIYSAAGKGSFAAPHSGVDGGRKEELLQLLDRTAAELLFLGVDGAELRARLEALEGGTAQ